MRIDLKQLFDIPGERYPIQVQVNMTDIALWGRKPFSRPVQVEGEIVNTAGVVTIHYQAKTVMDIVCDRCLAESRRAYEGAFTHGLVRNLCDEENDDYIVVEDGFLDLDGLVTEDITLEMPIQMLCREDCKGLCPQCGADRNKGDCGCKKPGDPRFDVLNDLLRS